MCLTCGSPSFCQIRELLWDPGKGNLSTGKSKEYSTKYSLGKSP